MALFGIRFNEKGGELQVLRPLSRDLRPLMTQIGKLMKAQAQLAFERQANPDGTPWPARKAPSIAQIVRGLNVGVFEASWMTRTRPALNETGALRRSIRAEVTGPKTVRLVAGVPYAKLHLEGGTDAIPVTRAAKDNLKNLLRAQPGLRPQLGFLFRENSVSFNVPIRSWIGVGMLREPVQRLVRDYLDREYAAREQQQESDS